MFHVEQKGVQGDVKQRPLFHMEQTIQAGGLLGDFMSELLNYQTALLNISHFTRTS